jgi:diguanylate cyclase (GGDEF)-like protein
MSSTDKLTRLYNARGFVRASEHELAILNGPMSCAMLLAIEVGNLKVIERALGREPVDLMLTRTADILRGVFRGAVIGRFGVDRFAVLILASPSKCTELIAALNEDIDAANLADPNLYLSLGGKYCLLDSQRSDSIESWIKSKKRSITEGVVIRDESDSSSRF